METFAKKSIKLLLAIKPFHRCVVLALVLPTAHTLAQDPNRIMLHIKQNDLSVAYSRTGNGPALVLLHGFAIDSRIWESQIESLSHDFTVIAWDAPGAGQSSDPAEPFGLSDWADCLHALLNSARI